MFNSIKPLCFYIYKKPIIFTNNKINLYDYIINSTNKYIKIICEFNQRKKVMKYILNENDTVDIDKKEEINKKYSVLHHLFIVSLLLFINL